MSQKILYNESRIFNRNLYDASRKGVQFYYWLDSVFYPGFVGKSSGGDLAMYQYVESGRMRYKSRYSHRHRHGRTPTDNGIGLCLPIFYRKITGSAEKSADPVILIFIYC